MKKQENNPPRPNTWQVIISTFFSLIEAMYLFWFVIIVHYVFMAIIIITTIVRALTLP